MKEHLDCEHSTQAVCCGGEPHVLAWSQQLQHSRMLPAQEWRPTLERTWIIALAQSAKYSWKVLESKATRSLIRITRPFHLPDVSSSFTYRGTFSACSHHLEARSALHDRKLLLGSKMQADAGDVLPKQQD